MHALSGATSNDAPTPLSPTARLSGSCDHVAGAVAQLESIADALCGPMPPAADGNGKLAAVRSEGVFGLIDEASDGLNRLAERADRALNRISAQLP